MQSFKTLKLASAVAVFSCLTACGGGGDVNIEPSTTVGDTIDNSCSGEGSCSSGGNNDRYSCASYTTGGTTFEGSFDGTNCTYTKSFVDVDNPIMVDVTIPNIGGGVHIFEGSLVVGQTHDSDAELTAAGITEGGDGPTLTVAAGNTLAFRSSDDFMLINRGSQIRANGTVDAPITLTSQADAVQGTVGPEDTQQWGGLVINGFGVNNKCAYSGTMPDVTLTGECHIIAEGKAGVGESNFGGDNNDDNSGVLRYVVVKYAGAEVGPGNELNGISWNAVGRGTTVDHIEVYSAYDDGMEFFGGAVDINNYVAVYARDDSIDIDEGYRGTLTNALVVQAEFDGNRCIESDGLGSYSSLDEATKADFISRGLHSQATIKNLTCIVSPNATGTHEPGQGWRIREAHFPKISNSILTTAYGPAEDVAADNYCVRIDDEGKQAALDGRLTIDSTVVACNVLSKGSLADGTSPVDWLNANGNATYQTPEAGEDPTATSAPDFVILDGIYSIPTADMKMPGATIPSPVNGVSHLGAVTRDADWTQGWTYGLHEGSRGKPLWFE